MKLLLWFRPKTCWGFFEELSWNQLFPQGFFFSKPCQEITGGILEGISKGKGTLGKTPGDTLRCSLKQLLKIVWRRSLTKIIDAISEITWEGVSVWITGRIPERTPGGIFRKISWWNSEGTLKVIPRRNFWTFTERFYDTSE